MHAGRSIVPPSHSTPVPHSLNLWEEIPLLFAMWLAGVVGYPHSSTQAMHACVDTVGAGREDTQREEI